MALPTPQGRLSQAEEKLQPIVESLNPKPQALNPKPQALNPKPQTLNPKPQALSLKPYALNLQPALRDLWVCMAGDGNEGDCSKCWQLFFFWEYRIFNILGSQVPYVASILGPKYSLFRYMGP